MNWRASRMTPRKGVWLNDRCQLSAPQAIGALRGGRNVLLYGSAFLQKPQTQSMSVSITP